MAYEIETLREIWPTNGEGERLEVGPDRDGLGLLEIRWREPQGEVRKRICLDIDAAFLVAKAINLCAAEMNAKD
jgi:hypothetical protein